MNTTQIHAHLTGCLPRLAPQLRAEARLAELALDSLDTVELLCVIHAEFGVRLTETEFHPAQTVGSLLNVIQARCRAGFQPAKGGILPDATQHGLKARRDRLEACPTTYPAF